MKKSLFTIGSLILIQDIEEANCVRLWDEIENGDLTMSESINEDGYPEYTIKDDHIHSIDEIDKED